MTDERTNSQGDGGQMGKNKVHVPRYVQLLPGTDIDWMERGACRGVITAGREPDEAFFPETRGPAHAAGHRAAADYAAAKFCRRCPVRAECLEFAGIQGYTGLWGGELVTQPRINAMRRQREAAAAPEAVAS